MPRPPASHWRFEGTASKVLTSVCTSPATPEDALDTSCHRSQAEKRFRTSGFAPWPRRQSLPKRLNGVSSEELHQQGGTGSNTCVCNGTSCRRFASAVGRARFVSAGCPVISRHGTGIRFGARQTGPQVCETQVDPPLPSLRLPRSTASGCMSSRPAKATPSDNEQAH